MDDTVPMMLKVNAKMLQQTRPLDFLPTMLPIRQIQWFYSYK